MRYFIYLSYNGSNYHGWQIQPNATTVQEVVQKALSLIIGRQIYLTGAGRTDTGVHARSMAAHFDCELSIDTDAICRQLNSLLPWDISVNRIVKVKSDAHARFSALSRTYEYMLHFDKNPFLKGLVYRHYRKLDFDAMNTAAAKMLEYTDFTSFSKLHTDTRTNNCKVSIAKWEQRGDIWVFTIKADRFLRDMVRATVGTLILVGEHSIDTEGFMRVIEAKDRQKAGQSIDACGLYLSDIEYDKNIFL